MKAAGSIRRSRFALGAAVMAGLAAFAAGSAWASEYHDIYVFNGAGDGAGPVGGLVMDSQGRLYGATSAGGDSGDGTVFRLTKAPSGSGEWTEEVLHSFSGRDGREPASGVIIGSDGSLYGTTKYGGGGTIGHGVVYKLANAPGWPITILHNFDNGLKGGVTQAGVVFGPSGLLYGTTGYFGMTTYAETGTVYSISPTAPFDYQRLHSFGRNDDGVGPSALVAVPPGYFSGFIGATQFTAGASVPGSIFAEEISPSGQATEIVLYRFQGSPNDVGFPFSPPTAGTGEIKTGLYGAALGGGTHGLGGVYRLARSGQGAVSESVLYNFGDQLNDPAGTEFDLIQGSYSGTLYGLSSGGGIHGNGTFYELDPPKNVGGGWTEKVDINFNYRDPIGGASPVGKLLRVGNIYYGALSTKRVGNGAIFEVTLQ